MNAPASGIVHSATLVDGGTTTPDAWLAFADGVVTARGVGASWREVAGASASAELVDAHGATLAPGFIDIHAHGALGAAFDDADAAELEEAVAYHRAHGTTSLVLSLVSAPVDRLTARLRELAAWAPAGIVGAHLEGPFLSPLRKGAHDPAALCVPDAASVDALLAAGDGFLRQVTLAPELPGGLEAVARIASAGVAPALGHSDADAEVARAAFDAGARIVTHTFNGMRGIHHRDPGAILPAAADRRITLEVIADGTHVHPQAIAMLHTLAPGRIAYVSDAMAATGCADGGYLLGGLPVVVHEGVARLRDGDSIAGSTATADQALRTAVLDAGVPLIDVITALTTTPAQAIGRPELGRLTVGSRADAVLLDAELHVARVWSAA